MKNQHPGEKTRHLISRKNRKASSERPRYGYSLAAGVFFSSIDLITGRAISLPKVKLMARVE